MQQFEGALKGLGRIIATGVGLIGVILAFLVNVGHTLSVDSQKGFGNGHFFLGLLTVLLGLIGALVSFFAPITAAVMMILSAVGLFFIAHGAAFIAIPLFVIAAILAFIDRRTPKKAA
jgi:hypothetical protein